MSSWSYVLVGCWVVALNAFAIAGARAEAKARGSKWYVLLFTKDWLKTSTPAGRRYRRLALGTFVLGLVVWLASDGTIGSK